MLQRYLQFRSLIVWACAWLLLFMSNSVADEIRLHAPAVTPRTLYELNRIQHHFEEKRYLCTSLEGPHCDLTLGTHGLDPKIEIDGLSPLNLKGLIHENAQSQAQSNADLPKGGSDNQYDQLAKLLELLKSPAVVESLLKKKAGANDLIVNLDALQDATEPHKTEELVDDSDGVEMLIQTVTIGENGQIDVNDAKKFNSVSDLNQFLQPSDALSSSLEELKNKELQKQGDEQVEMDSGNGKESFTQNSNLDVAQDAPKLNPSAPENKEEDVSSKESEEYHEEL